jgi:hypothetical protein
VAFTFDASPDFDGYLQQGYRLERRRGLIEAVPGATEQVRQSETEFALSRFSGANKIDLSFVYAAQEIKPDVEHPPHRSRRLLAARIGDQILRPLPWLHNPFSQHFATRGLHFFGGFADDREHFGTVLVRRDDLFAGTSINGLGPVDVTLQPTLFQQRVSGDRTQMSSQLRLDGLLLIRLLDEERHPGLPGSFLGLRPAFVHLVIPVKHDSALEGLQAFENDRVGIGLETKLFVLSSDGSGSGEGVRFGATTLLLGCHYYRERFPRLDKRVNLVDWNLSVGF